VLEISLKEMQSSPTFGPKIPELLIEAATSEASLFYLCSRITEDSIIILSTFLKIKQIFQEEKASSILAEKIDTLICNVFFIANDQLSKDQLDERCHQIRTKIRSINS
jgi:hypothetical protein